MFPSVRFSFYRRTHQFIKQLPRNFSETSTANKYNAISCLHINWVRLNKYNNNNNRTLSTVTKTKPQSFVSEDETREFMSCFPDIVRDLNDACKESFPPEMIKLYIELLHYSLTKGKKHRGLRVVAAYKLLEKPERLTPENIRLSNILGWCMEVWINSFLMFDDMMDSAEERRGLPCWYKKADVGLAGINHAVMLEQSLYILLKRYFFNYNCYIPIFELFHDMSLKTIFGEMLDGISAQVGKSNLDLFTMNRYLATAKYKTSYSTYALPMSLAMYLANIYDAVSHRQVGTIMNEMGQIFQFQDDFLDCFGNQKLMGKTGIDIRDGKCTWLAVVALERASPAQKRIMEEYYGRSDPEAVNIIRNLYVDLDLPNIYAAYEEEKFNQIRTHIEQISNELPKELFFKEIELIYKRDH